MTIRRPLPSIPSDNDSIFIGKKHGLQRLKVPHRAYRPFQIIENGVDTLTNFTQTLQRNIQVEKFLDTFQLQVAEHGDRTCFSMITSKGKLSQQISYRELQKGVYIITRRLLASMCVQKGVHVGIILGKDEGIESSMAFLACFSLGLIAVPLMSNGQEFEDVQYILKTHDISCILISSGVQRDLKNIGVDSSLEQLDVKFIQLDALPLTANSALPINQAEINPGDVAFISYEKTKTGELKGIAVCHETLTTQANIFGQMASLTFSDNLISLFDHRHPFGLLYSVLCTLYHGASTLFLTSTTQVSSKVILQCISKFQVTILPANYVIMAKITNQLHCVRPKEDMNIQCLRTLLLPIEQTNTDFETKLVSDLSVFGFRGAECICSVLCLAEHGHVIASSSKLTTRHPFQYSKPIEFHLDRISLQNFIVRNRERDSLDMSYGELRPFNISSAFWTLPYVKSCILKMDSNDIVPDNEVGEIAFQCSGLFPLDFCSNGVLKKKGFDLEHFSVDSSVQENKFFRTGLLGQVFKQTPNSQGDCIFVFVKKNDTITQMKPSFEMDNAQLHWFFLNDIQRLVMEEFDLITACTCFSIQVENLRLPVLILEMKHTQPNYEQLAVQIQKSIFYLARLLIFYIVICEQGTLSQLSRRESDANFLSQENVNFDVMKRNSIKNRFELMEKVDWQLCKAAFLQGKLKHLYFNTFSVSFPFPHLKPKKLLEMQYSAPSAVYQVDSLFKNFKYLDDLTLYNLNSFKSIIEILQFRCQCMGDFPAFSVFDSKEKCTDQIDFSKFWRSVAAYSKWLTQEKCLKPKSSVILVFENGIDFACNLYACFYSGLIAILVSPSDIQQDEILHQAFQKYNVSAIIGQVETEARMVHIGKAYAKSRQSRNASTKAMPGFIRGSLDAIKKIEHFEEGTPYSTDNLKEVALVTLSKSTESVFKLHDWSHLDLLEQTKIQVIQYQMLHSSTPTHVSSIVPTMAGYSSNRSLRNMSRMFPNASQHSFVAALDCYQGLGFISSFVLGIFVGSETRILPKKDFVQKPFVWLNLLANAKAKYAILTKQMVHYLLRPPNRKDANQLPAVLHLRYLVVLVDDLIAISFLNQVKRLCFLYGIDANTISFVLCDPLCPMLSSTGSRLPVLKVDKSLFLEGKVRAIHQSKYDFKESEFLDANENSTCTFFGSGIVPANIIVAIVKRDKTVCLPFEWGEIWMGFRSSNDSFTDLPSEAYSILPNLDARLKYHKTDFMGFLWPSTKNGDSAGWESYHPSTHHLNLFVLGCSEYTFCLPNKKLVISNIMEDTVKNAHPSIESACVVMDKQLLYVFVEVKDPYDFLGATLSVSKAFLAIHQLMVYKIIFSEDYAIKVNDSFEMQRWATFSSFTSGKLSPLKVVCMSNSSTFNHDLLSTNRSE